MLFATMETASSALSDLRSCPSKAAASSFSKAPGPQLPMHRLRSSISAQRPGGCRRRQGTTPSSRSTSLRTFVTADVNASTSAASDETRQLPRERLAGTRNRLTALTHLTRTSRASSAGARRSSQSLTETNAGEASGRGPTIQPPLKSVPGSPFFHRRHKIGFRHRRWHQHP